MFTEIFKKKRKILALILCTLMVFLGECTEIQASTGQNVAAESEVKQGSTVQSEKTQNGKTESEVKQGSTVQSEKTQNETAEGKDTQNDAEKGNDTQNGAAKGKDKENGAAKGEDEQNKPAQGGDEQSGNGQSEDITEETPKETSEETIKEIISVIIEETVKEISKSPDNTEEKEEKYKASGDQGVTRFPYSYQTGLLELARRHPKWKFVPIRTGLSWDDVVENENKKGRSTIQSTYPSGGKSGSPFSYLSYEDYSYDWSTDKFKLCDGTTWYYANPQVVAYYLDPRNFFDEEGIFQFQSLSYSASEKKKVVQKILSDSFMKGSFKYKLNNKDKSISYAEAFLRAGKKNKISAYFLASRARIELGKTKTSSVTGTVPGYTGYYNFYNIGANDTAGGGATINGLRFAMGGSQKSKTYGRPWNTEYKAIDGGAQFLAKTYLYSGQNTMYFQKFSVVKENYLYWHQYQTNIMAPSAESGKVYESYRDNGILNEEFTFYIPVYEDMPGEAAGLPKAKGNPNHYLKKISITDNNGKNLKTQLEPEFSYDILNYSLKVDEDVSSVKVEAATVSSYAKIKKGKGKKKLDAKGNKELKIVVKAQDNSKGVYTVKITGGKERPYDDPDYGNGETVSYSE